MNRLPRLGPAPLRALPPHTRSRIPPGRDGALTGQRTGIVHFGPGAFHRAHQAVFTEDAMAATDGYSWGICGVTQRSPAIGNQLTPQSGLYAVLTLDGTRPGTRPATLGGSQPAVRVVGSIAELLSAPDDPTEVAARIADPDVRVLTLTVTEKGYRRGPATGGPTRGDPPVRYERGQMLSASWRSSKWEKSSILERKLLDSNHEALGRQHG